MTRDEMYRAACDVANEAISAAKGITSDAKQLLHMAIALVHADESEQRAIAKTQQSRMPGRPR